MVELGADGIAFETIVATGREQRDPAPQPRPTGRSSAATCSKIDFGALYGGYHADCTRTVVVGREPADWQREIYDVVRAGAAGRPGARCAVGADVRDVDAAARAVVGRRRATAASSPTGSATASAWRSTRPR